jgi:hypothetical protein
VFIVFSLRLELSGLILKDKPLISKVVLSHCGGRKQVAKGETVHDISLFIGGGRGGVTWSGHRLTGDLTTHVGTTIEQSRQVACAQCAVDEWARAGDVSVDWRLLVGPAK